MKPILNSQFYFFSLAQNFSKQKMKVKFQIYPAPLLRQLSRITSYSKHSLDKGGKKVVLGDAGFLSHLTEVKVVLDKFDKKHISYSSSEIFIFLVLAFSIFGNLIVRIPFL